MSYSATVYKVMIACPSDAQDERQTARDVVHQWNCLQSDSEREGIVLLPIGWDTHIAPEMGSHPQEIIEKQLLQQADLLVGIFLHRLGTPTLNAQSGTADEIDSHTNSGKPTMIYFLKEDVDPAKFDPEQYDKLMAFKNDLEKRGVLHECDRNKFENVFLKHLTITINKNEYFRTETSEPEVSHVDDFDNTDEIIISDEAKELLIEASKDKHGQIMKIALMKGTVFQTNEKNMVPSGEPRIVAQWERALKELVENDFVEGKGYKGNIFAVTSKGYEYADELSAE